MKVIISLLFIVISLVGIADASYITYEEITGGEIKCGEGFDCGKVLDSAYAHIGPIPLYALGILFYSTFFILGVLNFLEFDLKKLPLLQNKVDWPHIFLIMGSGGFLFSLYLITIMGVVLNAWCKFCLISAATSTSLFIISVIYYLASPKQIQAPTE